MVFEIKDNWKFRIIGSEEWLEASVPGCLHTDLLVNEFIPDPFYRDNELKLGWVDKVPFEYKPIFKVDKSILNHENIELYTVKELANHEDWNILFLKKYKSINFK